jgi:hypothetical protein
VVAEAGVAAGLPPPHRAADYYGWWRRHDVELGFAGCSRGDADNFLWGIEEVRGAVTGPTVGAGAARQWAGQEEMTCRGEDEEGVAERKMSLATGVRREEEDNTGPRTHDN